MHDVASSSPNAMLFPDSARRVPAVLTDGAQRLLAVSFVVLQVAILVGMIVMDGLPYVFGERIRLQVQPVDPRDLFRGDYVVLDYDFSRTAAGAIRGIAARDGYDYQSERPVFVALKREKDRYVTDFVSTKRPANKIYLRGTSRGSYRVDCGIEAYYVQEGEGRRLENLIRQRRILAEVAVWNGQAKLVRLVE